MKKSIWISDLTHTAQGIGANGFPLGASYIYSYTKKKAGFGVLAMNISFL